MVVRVQLVPQRVKKEYRRKKQSGRGEGGCPSPLHLLHRGCPVSVSVTPTTVGDGMCLGSSTEWRRPIPSGP